MLVSREEWESLLCPAACVLGCAGAGLHAFALWGMCGLYSLLPLRALLGSDMAGV